MEAKERTSVEEAGEKRKIDLKIGIEDFGPVNDGEITLKPLTVFIGPNNSGKSYAAMLIYSLFRSYAPRIIHEGMPLSTRRVSISPEDVPELRTQFDNLQGGQELDVPEQSREKLARKFLENIYQERLSDEISRSFACRLNELIRARESSSALKITHDPYSVYLTFQGNELRIRKYPELHANIRLRATGDPTYLMKLTATGEDGYAIRYGPRSENEEERFLIEIGAPPGVGKDFLFAGLIGLISNLCAVRILEDATVQCHYLPAARSGILQLYRAFIAGILEKLEIPRLPGVVLDFLSSVTELPEERGPLYQIASHFEDELIQGEIIVSTRSEYLYPEIKYRFQDAQIPLHRSSSTVSELAPLFLYLKYKVGPGSVLMIEEPEAHLHPRNQRILATLLVRLVREGVNLVITTHSEYLLEQLSNFIMLSKVEEGERVTKYKYDKEDFLRSDEIAAYMFRYDERSGGHRIDEVEITEEDGISQDEFVKIIEELYEETIKLRRDLSNEA